MRKKSASPAAQAAGFKKSDDHPAADLAQSQSSVDSVLNTLPTLGQVMKDRPGADTLVRPVGQLNWAGVITLPLNAAAFVAVVVPGGVGVVENDHTEAAMAVGMQHRRILVQTLLPQACRR